MLIPKQERDGKVVERAVVYKADFTYRDEETGQDVVEDVKSKATKTRDYIIKRKLYVSDESFEPMIRSQAS